MNETLSVHSRFKFGTRVKKSGAQPIKYEVNTKQQRTQNEKEKISTIHRKGKILHKFNNHLFCKNVVALVNCNRAFEGIEGRVGSIW